MFGLVCALTIVFVVGYVVSLQMGLAERNEQLRTINEQIEKQEEENRQNQELLNSGNEKEIMERIAREKLGYVAPGERVFFDISGN